MTRRLAFATCLLLAGCVSPGTYNVNLGVGPLGGATGAVTSPVPGSPAPSGGSLGSPAPGASASPAPAAGAPGKLDQSQVSVTGFQQTGQGSRLAQTFTPRIGGQLVAIGLRLKASGPADRDAALVVRTVDADGHPAEALGAATLHGSSLAGDGNNWTLATLDAPVALTAGTRYAWVLTFPGATPLYVGAASDNSYLDGNGFTGLTDGSTFWNKLGQDLAFRTFMQ